MNTHAHRHVSTSRDVDRWCHSRQNNIQRMKPVGHGVPVVNGWRADGKAARRIDRYFPVGPAVDVDDVGGGLTYVHRQTADVAVRPTVPVFEPVLAQIGRRCSD